MTIGNGARAAPVRGARGGATVKAKFGRTGTPVKSKRRRPEDAIHRAVVGHLRARGVPNLFWWHTPSGAAFKSTIQGAIMKSLGWRSGIPDLVLLHDGKLYGLELKTVENHPTVEQLACIGAINRCGGFATFARGLDEALKCLETWGLLRAAKA